MQDKLNRRQYRHPPPSNNQEQLSQLQKLRDLAAEEEKDLETQIQLIKNTFAAPTRTTAFNNANNTNRGPYNQAHQRPMARTFMAHYGEHPQADDGHSGEYRYGYGYGRSSAVGTQAQGPPKIELLMEQYNLLQHCTNGEGTRVQCFLSPAESALRNASGVASPIECWGCTGHETHHANRFHSFRDCPNKYDPNVKSQAFRRMKQMREEWENRKRETGTTGGSRKREGQAMLSRTEAVRDWQHLGFNSRTEAEITADAVALMATDMSTRNHKNLSREWARKMKENSDMAEQQHEETTTPSYYGPATRSRNNSDQQTYHFIARVFQAFPMKQLPLEISPTLPHCDFPIGQTHGKGKLKIAVDSCAGVNIGHLEFHKAMADTFPELVASFKTVQEYGEKDIIIGGVEVSATSLKLTHIIECRTPFRYNGISCNLTFGLSEQAAVTAIVSINFLRKTKALWSYDDADPTIHLTIWQTTLGIKYEAPTRRVAPTPQDRFRAETTAVYTATTERAISLGGNTE